MAVLIKNGMVVVDPLEDQYQEADVLIQNQSIAAIDKSINAAGAEVIDAAGCWVAPGLIDAHTHLYGVMAAGMPLKADPPQNFPQILERIWWRLDKALTPDDIRISAWVGCLSSISHGVTTLFDHHASPSCPTGSLGLIAEVVQAAGLRASLAYEVSDRDGAVSRDAGIEENRSFFLECQRKNDPMLKAYFGLHAVFSVTDETLKRCAEIGNDIGAGFHLHVLEHKTEQEKFRAAHKGTDVVPFLHEQGILNGSTILAHTVHISRADAAILAESGVWNVHNPQSNMGNGVGIAPLRMMLDANLRTCLGSDGFFDLATQIVICQLLQTVNLGNPSAFGLRDVLKMVYGNNAALAEKTFGVRFGKIKPGYAADVIVLPYEHITPLEKFNFKSHLVNALSGGPSHVIINGAVRMQNKELMGVDPASIYAQCRNRAGELWQRF